MQKVTLCHKLFNEKLKFMQNVSLCHILFKGKLKLNVDDIYQLNYVLEDAEIVE